MQNHVGAVRPGGRRAASRMLACSMLASASLLSITTQQAFAQVAPPPAPRQSIDGNGVDLFWGKMAVDGPVVAAGQGGPESLVWQKFNRGDGWGDTVLATLTVSGSTVYVSFGGKSDRFTISGGSYIPTEGNGSTLSLSSGIYTYTTADGTVSHFSQTRVGTYPYSTVTGLVTDITLPSGASRSFNFETVNTCVRSKPGGFGYICTQRMDISRIASVTNNAGYTLSFLYANDASFYLDPDFVPYEPYENFWAEWGDIVGVSGSGGSQSFSAGWSGGSFNYEITDALGRVTKYRMTGNAVAGVTRPGSGSEDLTVGYVYSPTTRVASVATAAGTTTYSASDASGVRTVTVTDPGSHATVYTFDIASQRMTSMTDPLSRTTAWQYDGSGRVTRVTAPEGNYTEYTYDARGNVTETRVVAKSGSGVSDIVATADYDSSCTYAAKCNQPNYTVDARGNRTDYTYDTTTGLPTKVELPAASGGGIRPTTNYSYGTAASMAVVTGISTCQTTSSCVGTADEVKTSISYNSAALPTSISKGAGDASLTATTALTYDGAGNLLTVDGPLSGSADTVRYRYDGARRKIGVIGPDPDGGGSLKHRAQKLTYDVRDRVTLAETGTVDSQSDGDWAAFASAQQVATDYDDADRPVKRTVTASSTTYGVTQYSYDSDGRLECTAVRMNSATWGSLPGACTLATTGSLGPDRITKNSYDNADQLTKVQSAYGNTEQSDDATLTYTSNGKQATVTDAQGNKTSYEYDGADRLVKTRYPDTTQGAGTSSTSDYEQLTYDAGSNVTARRLRDGTSIGYTFDNLGRLTAKDLPGSEPDVAYTYDLLGRPLTAATASQTLTFGYDALSRNTSQAGPLGAVSYQYDLAGQRTRMTWPDSLYVDYDHLVTGEVSAIRENGATSGIGVLATYAYDNLGRRTGITRGNGTTTAYTYDNVSRLASLSQDMSGSTYDFTHSFTYNPAGQIASNTRSNDLYAWAGHFNVDRSYTNNGLNQATAAGATSLSYDSRGNLTTSGSDSYGYTSENLLTSGPSSVTLAYDPAMRLYQTAGVATTRFQYDGTAMIGEYNTSGTLLRRYVPGPGTDEPLAWYEGSGTSDRRWLHADERGSVVAVSNASGVVTNVNTYDEYGIPGSGNVGRFQYTGQAWLPELGMSYYKARIYSPTLGRFMQNDSIGYYDGMNWYNYVKSDPVNRADPSGNFGLFGGCPAGSRCESTNPAASNAADGYRNAKLNSEIARGIPGISTAGINQIRNCFNNPTSECMGSPVIGLPNFSLGANNYSSDAFGNSVQSHTVFWEVPASVITWIHIKHYSPEFFVGKSKFTDEIYGDLVNAIGKTIMFGKGTHGLGGQTIFTLDWGTQVGTLPDGSITNTMTVVGSHRVGDQEGRVRSAYPGPPTWP
ncbi:MAG: RHS repeat-associated core domain-containing protein [Sphingomonas sp.]|uniref:RHS repeat domain-containing protein n=1 Tax=Sphingomonas sp. TaxID=28214 RepID=UPI0025E0BF50|nr:RHS repeat-associated core domain-containing protein [Sphingomonas sp.]MBX3564025.1 RHS repeat-associated core domain-containing protein [Sphingomonas sp.]